MPRTQRSRIEVEGALVVAAIELVRSGGPTALTTRQVAAAADVNPGLLHRYFGSMKNLLGRVLDELAGRIAAEVGPLLDGGKGAPLDLYAQVLLYAVHEGLDPSDLQHEHPVVGRLLEIGTTVYGLEETTARWLSAQLLCLYLGWHAFGPFSATAAGIELGDPETEVAWLRQTAIDMAGIARARQDDAAAGAEREDVDAH